MEMAPSAFMRIALTALGRVVSPLPVYVTEHSAIIIRIVYSIGLVSFI